MDYKYEKIEQVLFCASNTSVFSKEQFDHDTLTVACAYCRKEKKHRELIPVDARTSELIQYFECYNKVDYVVYQPEWYNHYDVLAELWEHIEGNSYIVRKVIPHRLHQVDFVKIVIVAEGRVELDTLSEGQEGKVPHGIHREGEWKFLEHISKRKDLVVYDGLITDVVNFVNDKPHGWRERSTEMPDEKPIIRSAYYSYGKSVQNFKIEKYLQFLLRQYGDLPRELANLIISWLFVAEISNYIK